MLFDLLIFYFAFAVLKQNFKAGKICSFSVFFRYGRIDKVKVLTKRNPDDGVQAVVAFVDIRSAQKAHNSINMWGDKQLQTSYSEPAGTEQFAFLSVVCLW